MELGDGLKLLTGNIVLAAKQAGGSRAQSGRQIEFSETKADAKVRLFYLRFHQLVIRFGSLAGSGDCVCW